MPLQDLVTVGAKCQVVVRANNTLGLPGRLSSRCQPNHPTDDVEGILASMREGLSYGCGDAVIGVNPATDTPASTAEILTAIDGVLKRHAVPTQHCVLSHVTVQMKALDYTARAASPQGPPPSVWVLLLACGEVPSLDPA